MELESDRGQSFAAAALPAPTNPRPALSPNLHSTISYRRRCTYYYCTTLSGPLTITTTNTTCAVNVPTHPPGAAQSTYLDCQTHHTRFLLLLFEIMGFRWLVNAGLLALPIGTTVGVLMGVDMHRQTTGQEPLFNPNPGTGPGNGGGNGNIKDNRITEKQYCDLQVAVSPPSKGVKYTCKQTYARHQAPTCLARGGISCAES